MLLEGTDDADPVVGMKMRGGGRIDRGEPPVEGEVPLLPGHSLERAPELGIGGGGPRASPPPNAGGEGGAPPPPGGALPRAAGPPRPPGPPAGAARAVTPA